MKYTVDSATVRRVDESLTITELLNDQSFAFDFVVAHLSGDHPTVVNNKSDRVYFILEGSGAVVVSGVTYEVNPFDLIAIRKGEQHTISGELKYIIVTSPPFDPNNEKVV